MSEACTLQSIGADGLYASTYNRLFLREEKKRKEKGKGEEEKQKRRRKNKGKGEKEEKSFV